MFTVLLGFSYVSGLIGASVFIGLQVRELMSLR